MSRSKLTCGHLFVSILVSQHSALRSATLKNALIRDTLYDAKLAALGAVVRDIALSDAKHRKEL